jgi:predicted AAA+ superfamily ATPase
MFPDAPIYDLLSGAEAIRLARNPSLLTNELKILKPGTWVVIDEIQKVPALMDEVHGLIENYRLNFVLSGSSARKLRRHGTNLLAGRALLTRFFPLVSAEIGNTCQLPNAYTYGMLPKSVLSQRSQAFLKSYVQTYLKEEIQSEALTRNIGGFARFLEIAARQNGQITNVSNIARDAGVARQTVQGYFEILIDTLIGFWLPAWKLKSATKQVSHSKFYFFDSGIARTLSGRLSYPVTPEEKGPLVETWILHEIRAYLSYRELDYPIFYWSTPDQVEVDVLLETVDSYFALEIKSTSYWEKSFNRGLLRLKGEIRDKPVKTMGTFLGERPLESEGHRIYPVLQFLDMLWNDEIIK